MAILEKYIPVEDVPRMKLETIPSDPIISKEKFKDAYENNGKHINNIPLAVEKLGNVRTVQDSWIYKHFKASKKPTKIAIYVNAVVPINQKLCDRIDGEKISGVGNHCVVVKGIADWKNLKGETIECLELENNGGCHETKFIPVKHPFFEEVCVKVKAMCQKGSDVSKTPLNRYGKELAEIKWGKGKLKSDWYEQKREQEAQKKNQKENRPDKYEMLFVRATHPCYQLKFTS